MNLFRYLTEPDTDVSPVRRAETQLAHAGLIALPFAALGFWGAVTALAILTIKELLFDLTAPAPRVKKRWNTLEDLAVYWATAGLFLASGWLWWAALGALAVVTAYLLLEILF